MLDALIAARVIVVFFDQTYLSRPFCQAEWLSVLARWEALSHRPPRARGVVVLVPEQVNDELLSHMPSGMREVLWTKQPETADAEVFIREQFADPECLALQQLLPADEIQHLRDRSRAHSMIPPRATSLGEMPRFQLPAAPDGLFTGREEFLRELLQHVRATHLHSSVCLTGLGGSGKSRIVLEFVWRYGPQYFPGGVFWLDAGSPGTMNVQLHGLLQVLTPEIEPLANLLEYGIDLRQLLADALESQRDRKVLIVLENLPAGTAPRGAEGWLPASLGAASLLITSRTILPPPTFNLHLPPLPRWASLELLACSHSTNRVPLALANQIAERLGDWPLALQLLHIGLETSAISSHQLERLLAGADPDDTLDRTITLIRHYLPDLDALAISVTLQLSLDALAAADQELAFVLCWCADAPVPQELIEELVEDGIDPRAAVALRMSSWITPGATNLYGRMHPILAGFLRTLPPAQASLQRLAQVLRQIFSEAVQSYMDRQPLLQQLATHTLIVASREAVPILWRLELLGEVALLFCEMHQPTDCLAVRQDAWRLAQHPDVAHTDAPEQYLYELLNSNYVFAPNRLSLEQLEAAANLATNRHGPAHSISLAQRWLLAKYRLDVLREPEIARHLFEELLVAYRSASEPDYLSICATLSELAAIDRGANALESAERRQREAFALGSQWLGEGHPITQQAAHELVQTLILLGDYRDALQISGNLLQLRTEKLGRDNPTRLLSAHNHAELLYRLGDWEESARLFGEVVEARAKFLDPRHSRLLNSGAHWWRLRGLLGDSAALLELGALAVLMTDAAGLTHPWSRKVRGFVAEVGQLQHREVAPDCEPERVVRDELAASPPLAGQLAQMLITLGWQALEADQSEPFLHLEAAAWPHIQGPLSDRHPFVLLLHCQSELVRKERLTKLTLLVATLGSDHGDVVRLLSFVPGHSSS